MELVMVMLHAIGQQAIAGTNADQDLYDIKWGCLMSLGHKELNSWTLSRGIWDQQKFYNISIELSDVNLVPHKIWLDPIWNLHQIICTNKLMADSFE